MAKIRAERLTAEMEGDFAIFRIGMRINKYWKVRKWLPVFLAMRPMIQELYAQPDIGFLGANFHFGPRNIWQEQYWCGADHLLRYAHSREHHHLPAWGEFNRRIGSGGDVGIWHETFLVRSGEYETLYNNMPTHAMGVVGTLHPATGQRQSARERLGGLTTRTIKGAVMAEEVGG